MAKKLHEQDVTWTTLAKRSGTDHHPGHWMREGTIIEGRVTAPDGHVMVHTLPVGMWPVYSLGRRDMEMEVKQLRRRITEMLSNDLEDREARLAREAVKA